MANHWVFAGSSPVEVGPIAASSVLTDRPEDIDAAAGESDEDEWCQGWKSHPPALPGFSRRQSSQVHKGLNLNPQIASLGLSVAVDHGR
jgi:hypothetical protein